MKELRPGSAGRTEIRALFAFDLRRKANLLVGGDKSTDWRGWYTANIPIADDRFDEHQAAVRAQLEKTKKSQKTKKQRKGNGDESEAVGEEGPQQARRGQARRRD